MNLAIGRARNPQSAIGNQVAPQSDQPAIFPMFFRESVVTIEHIAIAKSCDDRFFPIRNPQSAIRNQLNPNSKITRGFS